MLDFSKAKLLTFDCYGTLIDWESGIFSALVPCWLRMENPYRRRGVDLALDGEFEANAERQNIGHIGRSWIRRPCLRRAARD